MKASAAFCVILAACTAASAAEPGDLWKVTSKPSMEGMPMELPAQTLQVCAPKEWKEPPGGMDERRKCRSTDFKLEGAKATWKVQCAGPPQMSGEGEITRDGADAYSGVIRLGSSDGTLTIKLDGKRLGDCADPK
ncbi:MAG TPA: DUF3617 family protein [Candidatus Polarisedimenticolaceae bacterium]|nr:DUF3617 family protein [Candidatus Polarisedimenticolaceae bacterium]